MNTNWNTKLRVIVLATITMAFAEVGSVTDGAAQTINMADYTNYPMFLNKSGPTNILFVVDLSNAQLPAAYGAYPISAKNGTVTVSAGNVRFASNVNMGILAGTTSFRQAMTELCERGHHKQPS